MVEKAKNINNSEIYEFDIKKYLPKDNFENSKTFRKYKDLIKIESYYLTCYYNNSQPYYYCCRYLFNFMMKNQIIISKFFIVLWNL